jgi:L-serine dehydratase
VSHQAPGIFGDVFGPVMRGPSSSHTAGSYHIGIMARALLGAPPVQVRARFDPAGSYARVYREQGVDRAFALGLLGWPLTDARFFRALDEAASAGLSLTFEIVELEEADHPNTIDIELSASGGTMATLRARSVGGGAIDVTRVNGWPVSLGGETHVALVEVSVDEVTDALSPLVSGAVTIEQIKRVDRPASRLLVVRRIVPLSPELRSYLVSVPGVRAVRELPPLAHVKRGRPLFESAEEMLALAVERGCSLGQVGIEYESRLLGLDEQEVGAEMTRRLAVMRAAVNEGLSASAPPMQLLTPTARLVLDAERAGRVAIGGLHTRAAARAMAVMHVNGAMGVVCAAPTGGSAGVIPGVIVSLMEERGLDETAAVRALFAGAAVGLIVAFRATFAAEVAGCQVEIGAAGAMAAAAVVEAAGGSAGQAADAAAIAFQNTMGSVCDLVQGMVEIPCHTRNAASASSAFVCADLAMGGYVNPIGLDDTIDAVYAVGRMMAPELRCTARGGLAVTPSALRLHRRAPGGRTRMTE